MPALPIVLVVDDEPLNRDLLRRVLYREYDIREAPDAESALSYLLASGPVDVVLCDQVMPGRSGTDLARDVKARFPQTVALLLTGYEDAPEVEQACKDGVVLAVVGKPWVAAQLKETIAKAVRLARGGT